jgi:hypothetical protein
VRDRSLALFRTVPVAPPEPTVTPLQAAALRKEAMEPTMASPRPVVGGPP